MNEYLYLVDDIILYRKKELTESDFYIIEYYLCNFIKYIKYYCRIHNKIKSKYLYSLKIFYLFECYSMNYFIQNKFIYLYKYILNKLKVVNDEINHLTFIPQNYKKEILDSFENIKNDIFYEIDDDYYYIIMNNEKIQIKQEFVFYQHKNYNFGDVFEYYKFLDNVFLMINKHDFILSIASIEVFDDIELYYNTVNENFLDELYKTKIDILIQKYKIHFYNNLNFLYDRNIKESVIYNSSLSYNIIIKIISIIYKNRNHNYFTFYRFIIEYLNLLKYVPDDIKPHIFYMIIYDLKFHEINIYKFIIEYYNSINYIEPIISINIFDHVIENITEYNLDLISIQDYKINKNRYDLLKNIDNNFNNEWLYTHILPIYNTDKKIKLNPKKYNYKLINIKKLKIYRYTDFIDNHLYTINTNIDIENFIKSQWSNPFYNMNPEQYPVVIKMDNEYLVIKNIDFFIKLCALGYRNILIKKQRYEFSNKYDIDHGIDIMHLKEFNILPRLKFIKNINQFHLEIDDTKDTIIFTNDGYHINIFKKFLNNIIFKHHDEFYNEELRNKKIIIVNDYNDFAYYDKCIYRKNYLLLYHDDKKFVNYDDYKIYLNLYDDEHVIEALSLMYKNSELKYNLSKFEKKFKIINNTKFFPKYIQNLNKNMNLINLDIVPKNIKQFYEHLKNKNYNQFYEYEQYKFLYFFYYRNEFAMMKLKFEIDNNENKLRFKLMDKKNESNCFVSLVKNIKDIDEYYFKIDTDDHKIDINTVGVLKIKSNYKKIIKKYKDGIYVPYTENYISINNVCLGPTERKGTWIANLKIDLYKSLNFRYILLWDDAKVKKRYSLKFLRMFKNINPMSWYGSMGYQQNYDIDSLYDMIKNIDIKDIIKKYKIKIKNDGIYTLESLFKLNNYNKCMDLFIIFTDGVNIFNDNNNNIINVDKYIMTDNMLLCGEYINDINNNFSKFSIIKNVFEFIKKSNKMYYDFF